MNDHTTTARPIKCQWYLLCANEADGLVDHPILGDVPTCQRCTDRHGLTLRYPAPANN